jgi:hypothetical protein
VVYRRGEAGSMTVPGWYSDPQWERALGAVALAFLVLYGVARAGGPVALATEAEPAARVAMAVYCAAASALRLDGAARSRGLRSGG